MISQLFPLGERKEQPWAAGKHQLKQDTLPRSVADKGGDTIDLRSLVSLEDSGETGNKQNLKQMTNPANEVYKII